MPCFQTPCFKIGVMTAAAFGPDVRRLITLPFCILGFFFFKAKNKSPCEYFCERVHACQNGKLIVGKVTAVLCPTQ